MKIKNIKKHKNKLLKLNLIKSKTYKKNNLENIKIEQIKIHLKKAFHIIYKYHLAKKKILFIGTPFKLEKKINYLIKKTRHISIPESIWINGIITNQSSCLKYLSKNIIKNTNATISKLLFKLKKKPDLVVILNQPSDFYANHESYIARIPIITVNCDLNISDYKSNYKIPGNFKFTKQKQGDNLFFSILAATLKKATIVKF